MLGETAHSAVPNAKSPIALAFAALLPKISQSRPYSGVKVILASKNEVPSQDDSCEAWKEAAMGWRSTAVMVMSIAPNRTAVWHERRIRNFSRGERE